MLLQGTRTHDSQGETEVAGRVWYVKEQDAKGSSGSNFCLKISYKDGAANFFGKRARDNGHILQLSRFRLDIRKKLFLRLEVKSWYRSAAT